MKLNFKPTAKYDPETGLFNYRAVDNVKCLGGIPENFGKFMLYCYLYKKQKVYQDIIHFMLEAYRRYEVVEGYIPRTVAFQPQEPADSEKYRWELIAEATRDVEARWDRTRQSHAQVLYWIIGVWEFDRDFCLRVIKRLKKHHWLIETLNKHKWHVESDQSFLAWGSGALRAYALGNRGWKAKAHLSTVGIWADATGISDRINTCYTLWFMQHVNPSLKRHAVKWFKKQDDVFEICRKKYETNTPGGTKTVQNDLNYLCLVKMREQL